MVRDMKIDDDKERRKVASALRGDPNDTLIPQSRDGFDGMTYHEAAFRFWNMCRRVRDASDVDIVYSTTSVLADLIDRLTTNIGVNRHGRACCTNCGCDDWCLASDGNARYCPNCGATVVSGGSA